MNKTMTYKLTAGRMKSGRWWGRLDSGEAYSRGEGDDAFTAMQNALNEADFLIDEDQSNAE